MLGHNLRVGRVRNYPAYAPAGEAAPYVFTPTEAAAETVRAV